MDWTDENKPKATRVEILDPKPEHVTTAEQLDKKSRWHRSTESLRAARREGCPGEEGGREGGTARNAQRAARSAQGVGWMLWNSVER